jgi:hypothetical protein
MHVWANPAVMAVTPLPDAITSTGTVLQLVVGEKQV